LCLYSGAVLQKQRVGRRSMASSVNRTTSLAVRADAQETSASTVTIEYQRQQAKAMQAYLREKSLQQSIADAQVFGWTKKNEISNGRWVMMGLAVGMLTEYATGVSFIDQIKLMVSYLGIVDVE